MATNTFNAANKAILEFNDVQNNDELLNKTKNNLYTFGESVRSGIANLNEEVSIFKHISIWFHRFEMNGNFFDFSQ